PASTLSIYTLLASAQIINVDIGLHRRSHRARLLRETMPGRKSNVSTTSHAPEEVVETTPSAPNKQSKEKEGFSVDDLSLPKSMIIRLAKGVLPANTQIHKDALLSMHKSATVFVSYIASNSNDNAQAGGKKTISPQDVMAALKDAELEGFLPRVEAELKSTLPALLA
ncbi:hypothetical protein AC579_7505, partial [Pseudocercospora musae]